MRDDANAARLSGEDLNYRLNIISKIGERWENQLSFDNLRLSERYVANELWLHVHLRIDRSNVQPQVLATSKIGTL